MTRSKQESTATIRPVNLATRRDSVFMASSSGWGLQQTPFWREDAVLAHPCWLRLCRVKDTEFFQQTEAKVVEALRIYAEGPQGRDGLERYLFADDAVRGFSFVDLCHKRFDVILMNPPFGLFTDAT